MSVLAFDAAKRKTGWAFRDGDKWVTGVIDVSGHKALDGVIAQAQYAGVTLVVIEDCYLDKNPKTLKALMESQSRIRVACERLGLCVQTVYAQTWQTSFDITGPRADRKLGAWRVAKMLGAGDISEDEADAVCLCEYARRMAEVEG